MQENTIICFKQDTKERKRFFKAASFAHPAKMVLGLQIYLIEHYTKPGDTILDPMAGSGTILIACTLGRNVVLVELEDKFVKMQQDNYEKIKSLGPMLGYTLGEATLLQGDARCLDGLLADNILFSPPFASQGKQLSGKVPLDAKRTNPRRPSEKLDWVDYAEYENQNNISNLPYGEISAVISSPPYAEVMDNSKSAQKQIETGKLQPRKGDIRKSKRTLSHISSLDNPENIGNLPYGKVDAVITSPPYEGSISGKELPESEKLVKRKSGKKKWGEHLRLGRSQLTNYADAVITSPPYAEAEAFHDKNWKPPHDTTNLHKTEYAPSNNNIGNLKSENYLEAMLQVYRQCHRVLKEKGLMVLVVKNFIRDKKVIRLDLDTIKLCEQAGFKLIETLKRKLIQQSFWRTIYHNKYPDVEKIEFEDVLVLEKQ